MDFEKYVNSRIHSVFDFLFKLIVINLIWMLVSSTGFIVLSLMPATVVVYIMINTMIHNRDVPLLKGFYKVFIKNYWKSQKIFLIILMVGFMVVFNIYYFFIIFVETPTVFTSIFFWLAIIFAIMFVSMFIHVFPVYIYFPNLTTWQTLKMAILMALRYIGRTTINLLLILGIGIFIIAFPLFTPVLALGGISLYVYLSLRLLRPKYEELTRSSEPLFVGDFLD